MKIAVCQFTYDPIPECASLTREINERYCARHGYTFHPDHVERVTDRPPHYAKLPTCLARLDGSADWLLMFDADAWFHDHSLLIEGLVEQYATPSTMLLFSIWRGRQLGRADSGVFLARNHDLTRQILREWYDVPLDESKAQASHTLSETDQGSMRVVIAPKYHEAVTIIPDPDAMNGWKGRFIRHLGGLPEHWKKREIERGLAGMPT